MKIFVATYPTRDKPSLVEIMENIKHEGAPATIFHPSYDVDNSLGKETLTKHGLDYKSTTDPWVDLVDKDIYLISNSDIFVYDCDLDPGLHLMAVAVVHKIPIVCVSNVFKSPEIPYFSGYIKAVIKPSDYDKVIKIAAAQENPLI